MDLASEMSLVFSGVDDGGAGEVALGKHCCEGGVIVLGDLLHATNNTEAGSRRSECHIRCASAFYDLRQWCEPTLGEFDRY